VKIAVVGGGIAGLAAARRLESLLPDAQIILLERDERLGGKIQTERVGGFVIEEAPDSFLSRKERGVGLCEELDLGDELIGRRPDKGSFVRIGSELHPLPAGLTGLIPTNVDAFAQSSLLSTEGRERLAAEVDIAPAPPGEDESIASFVSRRLGREAYEKLVEPLMAGIFGGDGEQLSLRATFPTLRALELEHGSVIRGLLAQSPSASTHPPFVTLRHGMDTLVGGLVGSLERTELRTASSVSALEERSRDGFSIELDRGVVIAADAVVLAVPAIVVAGLLSEIDEDLAASHREIPYGSSAIVTLAYAQADVRHPLDGYGYVVPRSEGSDVLACTWTSRKWDGRAPEDAVLLRVYAGRFGARDVTAAPDSELVSMARTEVRLLGIDADPVLTRINRWGHGMPQYVLGHPERLARIEAALSEHPGLAVAGAAYHGVGIPDCIHSGEAAAESVAHSLASATR
jgi:oxygen-dependent protoporphyrinogen oxidase